jgi:hypothetical protein
VHTFLDVFRAQRRADGALFDDFHRRGQRAGAQQQGDVLRFGQAHAAGDDGFAVGDGFVDGGGGNDFGLALFHQHHRHAFADVVAGEVGEDFRADVVEADVYPGQSFVVLAGLGVVDVVAGEFDLFAD